MRGAPPAFRPLQVLVSVNGVTMAEFGFRPWLPRLAKGETIVGHVRDFAEPVRTLFKQLGTQSVLLVPVRVEGHWWGHLGFDDCRTNREWSPTEIDTLKTLAELVGAAVAPHVGPEDLGRCQSHHREQPDDPLPVEPAEAVSS